MFGRRKAPKRESPDDGWYTILNYDKLRRPEWPIDESGTSSARRSAIFFDNVKVDSSDRSSEMEFYLIASLDPARDNFGFRMEKWFTSGLNKGKVVPVCFLKLSFKANDPTNTNLTFSRITAFILSKIDLLTKCHYIVSERQLAVNYKSVRISTHALALIMALTENKGNKPIVIEVSPQLKYRQLEAPKGWTERQLKTVWTPEKALQILKQRGDHVSATVIEKAKKKDDFSDTVLQFEALNKLLELIPVETVQLKLPKIVPLLPPSEDPLSKKVKLRLQN